MSCRCRIVWLMREMHDAAVRTGNPGPIGPLAQENSMETKAWHHRQSDRGNVRSGPIGPLCVILARSRGTAARQSRSDRSSRSTSPGKRYGNKDLAPPPLRHPGVRFMKNKAPLRHFRQTVPAAPHLSSPQHRAQHIADPDRAVAAMPGNRGARCNLLCRFG